MRPGNAHLNKLPRDSNHTWRSKQVKLQGQIRRCVWLPTAKTMPLALTLNESRWARESFPMSWNRKIQLLQDIWKRKEQMSRPFSERATAPQKYRHGEVTGRTWLPGHLLPNLGCGPTKRILQEWGREEDKREQYQRRDFLYTSYLRFHSNYYSHRHIKTFFKKFFFNRSNRSLQFRKE